MVVDERSACDEPSWPAWGRAEALALVSGWALALAVLLPPAIPSGPGRAVAALSLAAALGFWAVAVEILRSDIQDYIIPDGASAILAALGLAYATAAPCLSAGGAFGDGAEVAWMAAHALADAAATGAGSFAVFWLTGAAFRAAGRDALGFGDVKLAGALGVWLTPSDATLALELAALGAAACLLGSRFASARTSDLRDAAVPFGAFMAPAAWLTLILAPPLRDAGWLPW